MADVALQHHTARVNDVMIHYVIAGQGDQLCEARYLIDCSGCVRLRQDSFELIGKNLRIVARSLDCNDLDPAGLEFLAVAGIEQIVGH